MADTNAKKEEVFGLLAEVIKLSVRETISELRKMGFLNRDERQAYKSVSRKLFSHFEAISAGENGDPDITDALDSLIDDDYFPVLLYYYEDRLTVEQIAEIYQCEVSTITRNKKRLCLQIDTFLDS